jgi:hypothetical protein
MAYTTHKRLYLSCAYLGAMFLVAGTVFFRLQAFTGTVILQEGAIEHLAVRASEPGFALGLSQRSVPRDLLLLDDPRAMPALREDMNYDAVVLPFGLRLDRVTAGESHPPVHWLNVTGPDGQDDFRIEPGSPIAAGNRTLEVVGIGPWEGLVRTPAGAPMAALSFGSGPVLFLEAGRWYVPAPGTSIAFFWYADAPAFEAATRATPDESTGARWGARDGQAIQWFDNFVPGTGVKLRNGKRVQIVEDRRAERHIAVEITEGERARRVDVAANVQDDAALVLLEMPAAAERVVTLHAWREDIVLCRQLSPGQPPEDRELAPGETWHPAAGTASLYLRQVMANAAAVPGGQLSAVELRAGEKRYHVREGLVETVGDVRIAYRKEQRQPDARYALAAVGVDGAVMQSIELAERETRRIGAWLFSLAPENPAAPAGIALTARRRPGGFAQMAGLLLFVGGSFGLVLVRFGRTRAESGIGEPE